MKKWTLLFSAVAGLLLAPPALAQAVGDACTGTNRAYTVSGTSTAALICNGSTLELLEKDLTSPVRKGIATASPAATLHVNGEAILGNTGLACSATTEGAMRYNGTSDEMEYCNGTAWTSLSPAAGGGNLKVYKSDGVTVVGNYMGNYAAGCGGIVYADVSTGAVSSLDSMYCSNLTATTYFSGSNCSGTAYIGGGWMSYCGTGVADDTTTVCVYSAGPSSYSYNSRRNSAGICTNTSGSASLSTTKPSICGAGPCVVK